MALRKTGYGGYIGNGPKKTRQGCSKNSKGMKKYRGQGGPRKRVNISK